MRAPDFNKLHQATLSLTEGAVGPVELDATGASSFNVMVGDFHATLIHSAQLGADRALVIVNLGLPSMHEFEAVVYELLESTFGWMTEEPPVVAGCDSTTGEFVIQFYYPLQDAAAEGVLDKIQGITAWSTAG